MFRWLVWTHALMARAGRAGAVGGGRAAERVCAGGCGLTDQWG